MLSSEFYLSQVDQFNQQEEQVGRKSKWLSSVRAILFLFWLVVFLVLVNYREMQWAFIVSAVFIISFSVVLKIHNKIKFKRRQLQNLIRINELELERQHGNFKTLENGSRYMDDLHPYTNDLDVFGKNSLYQLINRTTSIIGQTKLADRLKNGLEIAAITETQEAVKALASQIGWAQSYQALGMHYVVPGKEFEHFQNWCQQPGQLIKVSWIKAVSIVLPALLIIMTLICAFTNISYYATLPLIIFNGVVLSKFFKYAGDTVDQTYKSVNLLRSFQRQIALIREKNFSNPLLLSLAQPFQSDDNNVGAKINQLTFLLNQLQSRGGMVHIVLNLAFLLDIQWLLRLEKWKSENAAAADDWFNRLAELEVLISLSGTAFNNSNWAYPEAGKEAYHFEATALGHPMLRPEVNITNDFAMLGKGEVILLTGPNMAGKSTFLRTVATNIVLARLGAPVCAEHMILNFGLEPFTAMRVADDLSENVSSFYAELKRINQLLETVVKGRQTIYFLDEILKGTNSADRHKGAEGLIRQLSNLGVSGFVSTHDLELGELAGEMEKVTNYSFESEVNGDEIIFDYKLRAGICTSFNACDLMRKMGIEV